MEHTENEGYKDEIGYTAWQSGYDAAMYDGMDLSSEMPCKCDACMKAYSEGEETAIKELCTSLGLPTMLAQDASPQSSQTDSIQGSRL